MSKSTVLLCGKTPFMVRRTSLCLAGYLDNTPLDACFTEVCTVCADFLNLNLTDTGACGRIYLNVTCFGYNQAWDIGQVCGSTIALCISLISISSTWERIALFLLT